MLSMNQRIAGQLVLIFFTITTLVHVIDWNGIAVISDQILSVSRWLFVISLCVYAWFKKTLTSWIFVSMVAGILIGYEYPVFSQTLVFLRQIFLNLVKVIVAPLLFSTLVVGIAGHSNLRQVGRLGWKSLLYFEVVTTIALVIGLVAINISQAGVGIIQPETLEKLPETRPLTWSEHIVDIFPSNFIKAILDGKVLQIVVFSVIFAISLALLKE
jgi:proton glutamate symport protein